MSKQEQEQDEVVQAAAQTGATETASKTENVTAQNGAGEAGKEAEKTTDTANANETDKPDDVPPDDVPPETETDKSETGKPKRGRPKGQPAAKAQTDDTPAELYGTDITAQKLYALAGVDEGSFPFALALDNRSSSMMAFPELGSQAAASLLPYAQNVPVTFENKGMLETFVINMNQFAELWDWNGQHGVVVRTHKESKDAAN